MLFERAKAENASYGKAYAAFLSNQTIGMVLSTLLAGFVIQSFGVTSYIPLIGITALAIALCAVFALTLPRGASSIRDAGQGAGMFAMVKESMKIIRSDKTIFNLMLVGMMTVSGEYFLFNVYQDVFVRTDVPAFYLGAAMAAGLALNALFTRGVFLLERALTLEKIILLVTLVTSISYAAFALASTPWMAVTMFIVILTIMELQGPIVSDYLNERIPSNVRTTVLSGVSFATRVATMFIRVGLAGMIALYGVTGSLLAQAAYLAIGGVIGWQLLVRCGCAHRVKPNEEHVAVLSKA